MKFNGWGAILRKFRLGMDDRKDLENIQSMIAEYNHRMLKFCSLLFSNTDSVISNSSNSWGME